METIQTFNKWVDKQIVAYNIIEHYSAIKRHELIIHAATWMNLKNMLSARIQTQKSIYCVISFIWSPRKNKSILWWQKADQWLPMSGSWADCLGRGIGEYFRALCLFLDSLLYILCIYYRFLLCCYHEAYIKHHIATTVYFKLLTI